MAKLHTINQSSKQLRRDYEMDGKGLICWFCPLCSTLTLHSEWQKHVRDEHPGVVIKEIHPSEGRA